MTGDYPDLRDIQTYLENLLARNEDRRHRYLTWLGSSITALSVLIWVALDEIENAPSMQSAEAILVLLTLLFIVYSFADSLLPEGFLGLFRTVTAPWETGRDPHYMSSFILENLTLVRERIVGWQLVAVLTNVPLLIVWWRSLSINLGTGTFALAVAVVRIILSVGSLALFLAFAHEKTLKAYQKSLKEAEQSMSGSQRLLLFFYKLARVEKALAFVIKVVFYGALVIPVAWLLTQHGGPVWTELRLAALTLAIGILIRFGAHTWTQVKWLGDENDAWGTIRASVLFGQLKNTDEILKNLKETAEQVVRLRYFPFKLPPG